MSHLILVRHGQSEWNSQNRFTGWVDVDLTANGKLEACKAGELIKDLNIDTKKSYMLGDRVSDYLAAKKTGIKFLIIGNKFKIKGKKNFTNIKQAINSIL